ncbi:TRAP transporter substrate-binding protein [Aquibaculum sediminis]|uniref:TRAP transporter substrate-binding protein n=1 Tax=Aquibaculum sediminis TaxID=3231907 RepID=UPI003454C9B4
MTRHILETTTPQNTRPQRTFVGRTLSVLLGSAGLLAVLAAVSTAEAQEHRWIAGTAVAANDPIALATDDFAERVERLTDGEVVIETHHGAALGGDRDLVETILQGGIHLATPGQALLSGWYRPAEVWTYPYLFDDADHKDRVWDAIRDDYAEAVVAEADLRPLVAVPRAPRLLTANQPVETPEDMAGLKIRVPETQMWLRTFERFGASPTPLPFPDVYQALRSGVIDGQENPLSLSWNSGFFEVNTHLNLTEHMMQDNIIVVGETFYQQLSSDQQEALQQAARETEEEFRARTQAETDELMEKVREAGIVVTEVDKEAFRAALEGFSEEFPHVQEWVERARTVE